MYKIMLKGLLTDNDLEKLNSMEGIIDLLCDIPNFNMDMYDELDEDKISLVDHTLSINLLTDSQIESNLRRSMDNNNLALINKKRLMALSLLYFGIKDENNKYVGYICPYTGKEYNLSDMYYELRKPYSERNKEKVLELEHIRPHSSGGGTVLFNCIPSSKEANNFSEKSDLHLLDWFNQSGSKYYDKERLYNLVSYILSAYSISFREYQESDLDYYENDINNDLEIDNDELENVKEYKEKVKNKKHISIEGYIPFLKQLINKLETEGYDVSLFNNKLVELENNNIISNINKYEIVQDVIENLFKEYSGDENTSYLTYSLNIDYIKLVNSINSNDRQEIETILRTRLSNIKYLVDINSKTMKDYFISLRDNQEVDIIYKDNHSQEEIQSFVENLKLSYDTKINIFIEILSERQYTSYEGGKTNKSNIFNQRNEIPFKGYESINGLNTSHFWSFNSQIYIIPLLFYNIYYNKKEKKYIDSDKDYSGPEYDNARKNILEYLSLRNDKIKSIEDYIDELDKKDKKTKQVQNLIDLRDSFRDKDIRLIRYEKELIEENMELKESISNTIRRVM